MEDETAEEEAWIPLAVVFCPGPVAQGFHTALCWVLYLQLVQGLGSHIQELVGKATWGGKRLGVQKLEATLCEMMRLMVSKGLRLLEREVY